MATEPVDPPPPLPSPKRDRRAAAGRRERAGARIVSRSTPRAESSVEPKSGSKSGSKSGARTRPCTGIAVTVGTAVMFLTRLPVGRHASPDPAVLARATCWFPLVGLVVGLSMAGVWTLVQSFAPSSVACLLTLVAGVLLTGAFHEDGLADMADSAGAFGAEAKLEIMRDSRVGTYGALALVLLVLARFVLLWELSVLTVATVAAALVAAHVLGRWSSVWLMARVPHARAGSDNGVVAEGVGTRELLLASLAALVALVPAVSLGGWPVLSTPPLALGIALLAGWRMRRRLGGITGDGLGATNVIVELAALLAVLLAARP